MDAACGLQSSNLNCLDNNTIHTFSCSFSVLCQSLVWYHLMQFFKQPIQLQEYSHIVHVWGCSPILRCSFEASDGLNEFLSRHIFSYASSCTPHPRQWVGGLVGSVALRLASLFTSIWPYKDQHFKKHTSKNATNVIMYPPEQANLVLAWKYTLEKIKWIHCANLLYGISWCDPHLNYKITCILCLYEDFPQSKSILCSLDGLNTLQSKQIFCIGLAFLYCVFNV